MGRYQATGFTLEQVIEPGLSAHLRTIQTNQPSQPILAVREVLTSGQPIGLTADRPMGEQYELVSFLGKLAPFDPTPFRIAALCGAPLLFSFGFKDADETYEFFATPPALLRFDPGVSHELQCFNWLAAFTAELETRIRRYPYQWANFYPFWSTPIASKPGEEEARSRNHLLQELHRPPERRAEAGSDAKATAAQ
jgi:predicted LPLAT superfamily acyltransferase